MKSEASIESTTMIASIVDSTSNQLIKPHSASLPAYYRSKLYSSNVGINSLVVSAHPLLSLIERLKCTESMPDFNLIADNLTHELNAFESKASNIHYPSETVILGRYLLTATLDECLAKTLQRLDTPLEFKAFTAISQDKIGPESRFFDIVEKAMEKPNNHLDLLELAYLCLSTGFEGHYHQQMNGRQSLDDKVDQLYQLIDKFRVHKPLHLFKREMSTPAPDKAFNKQSLRYLLFTGLIVGLSLLINHFALENKAEHVLSQELHWLR